MDGNSALDFATSALALISEHLAHERLAPLQRPVAEDSSWDAIAPDGLDRDHPGSVGIEVKIRLDRDLALQFLIATQTARPVDRVLLVVRDMPQSTDIERLSQDYGTALGIPVYIWTSRRLEAIARDIPVRAAAVTASHLRQAVAHFVRTPPPDAKPESPQVTELQRVLAQGKLVLFLGAGVSSSAHLPDWKALLARLALRSRGKNRSGLDQLLRSDNQSPLITARLLREALGKRFVDAVAESLYQDPVQPSPLISALAELCDRGWPAGVRAVVTYNYDDLLEQHLVGMKHASICSEDTNADGCLPIYHVHGLLPQPPSNGRPASQDVVLSEDAYHIQFTDPYSWQTTVQLRLLKEYHCLFVGSSLTDPNLRRLLEIANWKRPGLRHFAIVHDHWAQSAQAEQCVGTGATNHAKRFRAWESAAMAGLGVQLLWVKQYEAIPNLIDAIR